MTSITDGGGASLQELEAQYGPNYRWLVIVAAITCTFGQVLASTTINVAIPEIMGTFGLGHDQAQWLSTGFLAATTVCMLLAAWFTERFGFRATFIGAIIANEIGGVIGGFAPNEDVLIVARVLQGAASGIIQPMTMLLIFQVFPPSRRGSAMGVFAIGTVLAPALGPTLAGVLMDELSWRFVFFMGLPFDFVGLLMAMAFIPGRIAAVRRDFDWIGTILLTIGVGLLLVALSRGQREGWLADEVLLYFLGATGVLAAFTLWELFVPHPLLNLRIFLLGRFAAAAFVSFVIGVALFGSTYLIPLFVQEVQGYSATDAGLLLLPGGLAIGLTFSITGRLADLWPPWTLIFIGLALSAVSCLLLAGADASTTFWNLAIWSVIGRLGFAFLFPALGIGSLKILPPQHLAQGSGIINFTRQLGGSFGVNLLASALIARSAFHAEGFNADQTADNQTMMTAVRELTHLFARLGIPDALQFPAAMQQLGRIITAQANLAGYQDGFLILGVVAIVAMAPALLMITGPGKKVG